MKLHCSTTIVVRLSIIAAVLGMGSACSKSDSASAPSTKTLMVSGDVRMEGTQPATQPTAKPAQPSAKDVAIIKKHANYPQLTAILAVKDAQKAAALIVAASGEVLYDPNRGKGSSIPFLVANLPPAKFLDPDFISSLNLNAIEVEAPDHANSVKILDAPTSLSTMEAKVTSAIAKAKTAVQKSTANTNNPSQLFIPTQDIGIPALRALHPGKGLGENTIVAIIDTGVDASHPVFQDRVIYWADHTQEGKFGLTPAKVDNGKISADGFDGIKIPDALKANTTLYVGTIDESLLSTQLADADKLAGKKGLDLNKNGELDDQFQVIVGKDATTSAWIAYVDTDGQGTFTAQELAHPYMDFNDAREAKRQGKAAPYPEMLTFPSEASTIAYPLLFGLDATGTPESITVGFDGIDHGTHVAGIIGGNGYGPLASDKAPVDDGRALMGSAPNVEIMALKVCSGLTCSDSALFRAMIDAFYNPKGYLPDVVNLSIGSLQENQQGVMDFLIRDLSEKFGATFVIANGNDGPAYRTGNQIGAFAPTIQVGAYVSKNTLSKQYTDDPGLAGVPADSMFYFSSSGPSFTGEIRPNIVAPGSALSSIPLVDGGSEMMNGTSMATPITTGAIAAMISLARADGVWNEVDALRAARADAIRNETNTVATATSLIGIPMTLRTSIEDSGKSFPGYTMPQQGFGLLQIDKAYGALKKTVSKIKAEPQDFFELTLNSDTAINKLYDRSLNVAPSKDIQLGLRPDGERPDGVSFQISTSAIVAKLVNVQVQDIDGTVTELKAPLPFSIGLYNGQAPDPDMTTASLPNPNRDGFKSIRHLNQMTAGKTYVAHYDILSNGVRVTTVTDVVHLPILLGDTTSQVSLPGIAPGSQNMIATYANASQSIAVNGNHHYFVGVTERDSALKIGFGFSPGATGTLILTVNDPDGNSVGQAVINALPAMGLVNPTSTTVVQIPLTNSGQIKSGSYEVTVANGSRRGLTPSKYDLYVQAIRFKASVADVNLATAALAAMNPLPTTATVSVMSSSAEVDMSTVKVALSPALSLESLNPFPVEPNRTTLKRIHVPVAGPSDPSTTSVAVDFGASMANSNLNINSRIDNFLYAYDPSTQQFHVAYTADATASANTAKVFLGVTRPSADSSTGADPSAASSDSEILYAAVETYFIDPNSMGAAPPQGIDVEATYLVPALATGFLAGIDQQNSSSDVLLVNIMAPQKIDGLSKDQLAHPAPRARAGLTIGTGDAAFQIKLPITIFE